MNAHTTTRLALVFSGEARAWYAGVDVRDYMLDADAAYEVAVRSQEVIRERFGLEVGPALMGNSYGSLFALGAELCFADGGTPNVRLCLRRLEDFRQWGEYRPFDDPTAQRILSVWRRVRERLAVEIGLPFGNEAPFTAAVLVRGAEFFVDILDQPGLASELLERLTDNWIACHAAVTAAQGQEAEGADVGLADDFSGMIRPGQYRQFVLPTYRRIFDELKARRRSLHSELLRPEHLPLLGEVGIDHFDPHVDQYLTPQDIEAHLPAGIEWDWRVVTSHMNINAPQQLVAEYEEGVRAGAKRIKVCVMPEVPDENVRAILDVGRKYGG